MHHKMEHARDLCSYDMLHDFGLFLLVPLEFHVLNATSQNAENTTPAVLLGKRIHVKEFVHGFPRREPQRERERERAKAAVKGMKDGQQR